MANDQIFKEGHALVIGVGSHKFHPKYNVPITSRDARAVRDLLVDPQTCGYPQQQTEFLNDETATKQDVESALKGLAKRVTEKDTVFLYFAGHGAFGTDDNYYLATHDVKFANTGGKELAIEAGTGLNQVTLVEMLKQIKAKRLLMIFNACHSGSLQPDALGGAEAGMAEGQSMPDVTTSALLGTGEGRIVISACKPDQLSSFLKTSDLTWFTEALKDGLLGKSIPVGGTIRAFNLYTYVYEAVKQSAEKFNVPQDPMITVLQGVGPFPVALASSSAVEALGVAGGDAPLPKGAPVRRVTDEESQLWMSKIENQTIVKGDYTGGDKVEGDKIGQQINTGGGAFFGGNVTASRDVIGGDQVTNIEGDNVGGDSITIGDISGSSGVAIGRGASSSVSGQPPRALSPAQQRMILLGALGGDEFSEPELMSLAILLGFNYADLRGDDQPSKASSLLKAVESQGNMATLKERAVMFKPDLKDVLG
jgi:hypothetical protein